MRVRQSRRGLRADGRPIGIEITTPETLTLFVRLFIELGSLRVHLGGCTANPNAVWVTQQARNWAGKLPDAEARFRFLVRGRDRKGLCR
jgi:putative transposase